MRLADFHFRLPLKVKGGHVTSMGNEEAFSRTSWEEGHVLLMQACLIFLIALFKSERRFGPLVLSAKPSMIMGDATPLKHKCMSFLPQCQYVACKIILSSSNTPQTYPLFLSLLAIVNSSFWFGTSRDAAKNAFFFLMAVIAAIPPITFTVSSGVGIVSVSVLCHVIKAGEKKSE